MRTLGISGHRPKYWKYSEQASSQLEAMVREALEEMKPGRVITGMALGMDLAAARAARTLGIPYVAAVPFAGQEAIWPEAARAEYAELLAAANVVEIITPGGFSDDAFRKRNAFIVANSHEMLVLHDGGSRSGTGHAVSLAIERGLPVHNLWGKFCAARPQAS